MENKPSIPENETEKHANKKMREKWKIKKNRGCLPSSSSLSSDWLINHQFYHLYNNIVDCNIVMKFYACVWSKLIESNGLVSRIESIDNKDKAYSQKLCKKQRIIKWSMVELLGPIGVRLVEIDKNRWIFVWSG